MAAKNIITINRATSDVPIKIYFQLIERAGDKLNYLLNDMKEAITELKLEDTVTVADIKALNGGEMAIVYEVNMEKVEYATQCLTLLEIVFKQFFDKHPTYVEPPTF